MNALLRFAVLVLAVVTLALGACNYTPAEPPQDSGKNTVGQPSTGGVTKNPPISEHIYTVVMTDRGFEPKSIIIRAGEGVTWVNQGTEFRWPASDVHPVHAAYPEKGGCIGSKFDACNVVRPGESFIFFFKYTGTWTYHDHLKPELTGTVIVK